MDKLVNQDVMMDILQMEALTEFALDVMNHVLHVLIVEIPVIDLSVIHVHQDLTLDMNKIAMNSA